MTRNLSCSIPCPAGKCRACDLERAGQTLGVHDRPTLDLTLDDLGELAKEVDALSDEDDDPFHAKLSPPKDKPIDPGPRRFGANFTPPTDTGLLVFMSYLPEGSDGSETCANCGKHVSRHYGGTQYRCFAVPEGHPDWKGDQSSLNWQVTVTANAVNHALYDTKCEVHGGFIPIREEEKVFILPRLEVAPGYELLAAILDEALEQAQAGKGKERHATDGDAFHDQGICHINLSLGSSDGDLYQAIKKLLESKRLPPARRRAERLGAINYIVASIIVDDDLDEQAERKKERS